jgi:hypothetical protein
MAFLIWDLGMDDEQARRSWFKYCLSTKIFAIAPF